MRSALPQAAACLLWGVLAVGCTKSTLEPIPASRVFRDDKVDVGGEICTRTPESRVLPLRVMFIVDCSESMRVTDPPDPVTGETGREAAVRMTWQRLLATGASDVRFSIIRFSAEAQAQTPVGMPLPTSYFTADPAQLASATLSLRRTDRTTNFTAALGEAYFEMRTELAATDQSLLPLSRFVVIFVSDGIPDVDARSGRSNVEAAILAGIDDLQSLATLYHVGDFSFSTAFLSAQATSVSIFDQTAQDLLSRMAAKGDGSFRSFFSGETLNFLFVDFTFLRRIFTLRSLTVVNVNTIVDTRQIDPYFVSPLLTALDGGIPIDAALDPDATVPMMPDAGVPDTDAMPPPPPPDLATEMTDIDDDGYPTCGEPFVDTDGDGLSDYTERRVGSDILIPDSDDDGLSDRVEWLLRASGLDPLNPMDSDCFTPGQCIDADMNGYCDCSLDLDLNGVCDCADPGSMTMCADMLGHDCVDVDMDTFCDCPDFDMDGLCNYEDRDGDLLHDCEEVYFGTSQIGVDTDADAIPDFVETRAGGDPVADDRLEDSDWDNAPNGVEVTTGSDPWCDDSVVRSYGAYQFLQDSSMLDEGTACYSFDIGNVTLVPTAPNPAAAYPGNGWNRILVYAGEVSFDDPSSYASFRVACVMAFYAPTGSYRNPPSGRIRLTSEDFVDVTTFDPDLNCRWP